MNLQGSVYTRNPDNKSDSLFSENWLGKLPATEGKKTAPWEISTLGSIIRRLRNNHFLVIYEITDLGRDLVEALEITAAIFELGAILFIVSENVFVADVNKPGIPGFSSGKRKTLAEYLIALADLDRRRKSERTKNGLQRKQAKGHKLGRPPGSSGTSGSRLDLHKEEIIRLLRGGCTQAYLAREYEVAASTMNVWIKKHARGK